MGFGIEMGWMTSWALSAGTKCTQQAMMKGAGVSIAVAILVILVALFVAFVVQVSDDARAPGFDGNPGMQMQQMPPSGYGGYPPSRPGSNYSGAPLVGGTAPPGGVSSSMPAG